MRAPLIYHIYRTFFIEKGSIDPGKICHIEYNNASTRKGEADNGYKIVRSYAESFKSTFFA